MAEHLTAENHSIHDFNTHQIITETWTGSTSMSIYDGADSNGASIIAKLTNGTDVSRYIIEIGHDGTDTGIDVTEMLISGTQMDISFTTAITSGDLVLTITNSAGAENNTIKYYAVPSLL